jgi:hypothetical protein
LLPVIDMHANGYDPHAPSTTLRSLRELRAVPLPRYAALRGGGCRLGREGGEDLVEQPLFLALVAGGEMKRLHAPRARRARNLPAGRGRQMGALGCQ